MSSNDLHQKIAHLERELAEAKARIYEANQVIDSAVTIVDRLVDKYRVEKDRADKKRMDLLLDAYFR